MAHTQSELLEIYETVRDAGHLESAIAACHRYGATLEQMLGKSQAAQCVLARRDWWLELHERGLSYAEIARLAKRSHPTVAQGVGAAAARRAQRGHQPTAQAAAPEQRARIVHILMVDGYPCEVEGEACRAS